MDTKDNDFWSESNSLLSSFSQLMKGRKSTGDSWTSIDDVKFRADTYGYIQELFAKREKMAPSLPVTVWESQVLDALHLKFLELRIGNSADNKQIPYLNDHNTVKVKNGQVVRFRCMIQDHISTEYSLSEVTKTHPVTGEVTKESTLLRDFADVSDDGILQNFSEKEVFLAVSPPAENFWVSKEMMSHSVAALESKRSKLDETDANSISLPDYKNVLPLVFVNVGESKPMACILKVYKRNDTSENWKHNDLIEVTGLITIPTCETLVNSEENTSDEISYPGMGKLPILHAFSCIRLADGSPRVLCIEKQLFPMFPFTDIPVTECFLTLRDLLSLGLGGDRYAAAYVMCALVSRVQFMDDQQEGSIGRVIVNVSGIPNSSDIPDLLTYIIKSLVPRTATLDFNVSKVNSWTLVPKKNMSTGQLEPGLLQLPVGTNMIIDETNLEEGKFDDAGARNILTLKEMLQEQKVKYDYTYQFPQIEANFPTIVLSSHPSVLPTDLRINVKVNVNLTLEEKRARVEQILKNKGDMLRNYLTMQRHLPLPTRLYDYSDDMLINDIIAYLSMRNSRVPALNTKMTATEYSAFISCCRSWCLLQGGSCITRDGFKYWSELELIRDGRMA